MGAPRADSASARSPKRLFSDDFERAELGKYHGWVIVVLTYALENGTLKGTQMRFDAPAKPTGW